MEANPFKPTAGKMPPVLIGRQSIVDDFVEALENGAGAPGRLMLIMGQRGFGKTVMLTELGRTAIANGWEVYPETASNGMVARLVAALGSKQPRVQQASFAPSVSVAGLAGMQLGSVSVAGPQEAHTLRDAIERRLKKLPKGKGILFTIDEAQAASTEEMVAVSTTVQHVIGDEDLRAASDIEQHGIAFAFAALPAIVDDLDSNKVLTFLRRAMFHELGSVPIPDVRNAYLESIAASGKTIDVGLAQTAAQATDGNPYLVQLVGYYLWQSAKARGSSKIEERDVEQGIEDAQDQFPRAVCAPSYRSLTSAQQHFLRAMAPDFPHAATLSNIAARAGKSMSWVGKYRTSLEKSQMIHTTDWGMVAYSMPYFGEWIAREIAR